MKKHFVFFLISPIIVIHSFSQDYLKMQFIPGNSTGVNIPIISNPNLPVLMQSQTTDIPITNLAFTTQTENSIFIHPLNPSVILNSNNSSNSYPYFQRFGASKFYSYDGGYTWKGNEFPPKGNNGGDPAVAIGNNGRFYINYIKNQGQAVAVSLNSGATWGEAIISKPYMETDKNHFWVDNSNASPFNGDLYCAWTEFGSVYNKQIVISHSTTYGYYWSNPKNISSNINAGVVNQGVNIQTGPNGEVYACWAVYDEFAWDNDRDECLPPPGNYHENALGFAKLTDPSQWPNWTAAKRIISSIHGIRSYPAQCCGFFPQCGVDIYSCYLTPDKLSIGGGKHMRTNSFPSMTVNQQTGEIYIVWTNRGIPGINTGDPDIYLIKSSDKGETWSTPVRINQDAIGNDKDQWFPWIACDEATGALVVIYYDSRDFTNNDKVNTYVSISYDGGNNWNDYLISDVAWDGQSIEGLCNFKGGNYRKGYAGDYIGIDISNNRIVPVWSDNRTGNFLAYTQPFCIPCKATDLLLTSATINATVAYKIYDNITLPAGNSYIITPSGNVELEANSEILIEGEFESQGEFYAHIVHCDNSGFAGGNACRKSTNNNIQNNINIKSSANVANKPDFPASWLSNSFQRRIFPNPSKGILNVETQNFKNQKVKISLTNFLGEKIYEAIIQSQNHTLDLSSHPKGIYFVKLQTDSQLWVDKIILQ